MSRLQELNTQGQSVWLDYIERDMIQNGDLQALVDRGVRGVTSNPAIFQQAILGSAAYDADIQRLADTGVDANAIFEGLAIPDIQAAADVLRPIYDISNGVDGYVSLEVAPDLAYDEAKTVSEAKRLFAAVDRPNVMIKVPATVAGVAAMEKLIAAGLNINVTLIFGLERYAAVKEAYIRGLEKRVAAGQPVDRIASVASFFISRVDSNVDAQLQKLVDQAESDGDKECYVSVMGKAAVANAQVAYQQFGHKFAGPRWGALEHKGAMVQRPLWASTSTKNPAYPDVLYVDTLIGPNTVNTMPMDTLEAFEDHGTLARTIDADIAAANAALAGLAAVGIDMGQVADELEAEGVKKFADAFDKLLAAIETQRKELA